MIWGVVVGAAVLVVVAGVAKLARPEVTAEAVRAAGVPAAQGLMYALGVTELVVGATVIAWQWRPAAAALGLLYVGFTVFSVRLLLVRGATASCGCFGQRHAPVGIEHVVVNLLVALVVFDAVAGIGPSTVDPVAAVGATALLFVLLAVIPGLRTSRT